MISLHNTATHTNSPFVSRLILKLHPCPVSFVVRFWSDSQGLLPPRNQELRKDKGFREYSEGVWEKSRNQAEQGKIGL